MNRAQADLLINMIKNECKSHKNCCAGCPFEYIGEEGLGSCIVEDGFIPEDYNNKLLNK